VSEPVEITTAGGVQDGEIVRGEIITPTYLGVGKAEVANPPGAVEQLGIEIRALRARVEHLELENAELRRQLA
jgi:hypothetical protein